MDGTLVDNMRWHAQAWLETATRLGVHGLTLERFERDFAGQKNAEIFHALLGRWLEPAELARLEGQKEDRYRSLYRPHLAPLPGLLPFLDDLARRGVVLGVATAAPPGNRELVLGGLGLEPRFARVIGAEHAKRGKPSPDIYLAAAEALGVEPARCLAFEDARFGVMAAVAAGMSCVGIATVLGEGELREAGAAFTARDFVEAGRTLEGLWPA